MLTAEYGGTGGRPIEQGMIVEEPDIEIGAGVSSKGMLSHRFPYFQAPSRWTYSHLYSYSHEPANCN